MITQKDLKKILNYDSETGLFTWKVGRVGASKDKIAGCKDKKYYMIMINRKSYLAHRLAWLYMYGEWPNIIDHIDGNSFNNKISNLRNASAYQNGWNRPVESFGKSKIKNVNWCNTKKRWLVKLQYLGKRLHIGTFKDLELAELVAEEARLKYYGEFARSC